MQILKGKENIVFFFSGFILIIAYIIIFKPLYDVGDASVYLQYAQAILGNGSREILLHRAPLYPCLLALLISVFSQQAAIHLMVVLQFALLYVSGIMIYQILITNVFERKLPALSVTFLMLINLSGLFYSYILLTEILTMFLLIISVYFLIKGINKSSMQFFFIAGVSISAMILTRFNTLPIIFVFGLIILLFKFERQNKNLWTKLRHILVFLIPVTIILNGYAFFNFHSHGFYGLFPMGGSGTVSRNALILTIKGSENVSSENRNILMIFCEAKRSLEERKSPEPKGSLARFDKLKLTEKIYGGYVAYVLALPDLLNYFKISPAKPEPELSKSLEPFFSEIRRINHKQVWELRLLSFLNSFRSSSGIVIPEKSGTNLGALPDCVITGYKLVVPVLSFVIFIISVVYLFLCSFKVIDSNRTIIIFILIILGFYIINFAFGTVGDANRYKFPTEPFSIALGVSFFYNSLMYFRKRKKIQNFLVRKDLWFDKQYTLNI